MANLFGPFRANGNSTPASEEEINFIKAIGLPERQTSSSLVLNAYGDGTRAAPNFFIKVTRKGSDYKVITNDDWTLNRLLDKKPREIRERVITVDDCGGSFPVGGLHCGVHDSLTDKCHFKLVDHTYFQPLIYDNKVSLGEWSTEEVLHPHHILFAQNVLSILDSLPKINPSETTFLICCGNMNLGAKGLLRSRGYLTELERVLDPLQSSLEEHHSLYTHELCLAYANPKPENDADLDLYRDPKKQMALFNGDPKAVMCNYIRVVHRIVKYNLQPIVKTAYKNLRKKLEEIVGSTDPIQTNENYDSGLFDSNLTQIGQDTYDILGDSTEEIPF